MSTSFWNRLLLRSTRVFTSLAASARAAGAAPCPCRWPRPRPGVRRSAGRDGPTAPSDHRARCRWRRSPSRTTVDPERGRPPGLPARYPEPRVRLYHRHVGGALRATRAPAGSGARRAGSGSPSPPACHITSSQPCSAGITVTCGHSLLSMFSLGCSASLWVSLLPCG
jgi:hypothetical protein